MRVLLVEDEEPLAGYIAIGLRKHGLAVDIAHDGQTALDKCDFTPYDVVVLDRDLPVVHGDAVCRRLAERGTARVLMLTASGTVEDRVDGLSLGADDYLGKPFAFSELIARVRALARRSAPARPPLLRAADVVCDPGRRTVERAGRPIHLTPKEFGVLEQLLAMVADLDITVERSRRTLDGLLVLAHSQVATGERGAVDLAVLVADLLDTEAGKLADRGLTASRALDPAPVVGDPVLLERLAVNLIDNAARYNRPGGHIDVSTGTTADRSFLRIANPGPRVAPETVVALLEPFVRGGRDRVRGTGGAGLGLSIVRAVVTAHDGTLTITAKPEGGLDITVELPRAAADRSPSVPA